MFVIPKEEQEFTTEDLDTELLQLGLAKEQAGKLGLSLEPYEIREAIIKDKLGLVKCQVTVDSDGDFRLNVGGESVTCTSGGNHTRYFNKIAIEDFNEPIPADILNKCGKVKEMFSCETALHIYTPQWDKDPLVMLNFPTWKLDYIVAQWEEFYEIPQEKKIIAKKPEHDYSNNYNINDHTPEENIKRIKQKRGWFSR